jgi:ribosomal protein L9
MPIDELKKKLKEIIDNTNDEDLLNIMEEDAAFYGSVKEKDITDELTNEQFNELRELATEDEERDLNTPDEFNKATERWRTR